MDSFDALSTRWIVNSSDDADPEKDIPDVGDVAIVDGISYRFESTGIPSSTYRRDFNNCAQCDFEECCRYGSIPFDYFHLPFSCGNTFFLKKV